MFETPMLTSQTSAEASGISHPNWMDPTTMHSLQQQQQQQHHQQPPLSLPTTTTTTSAVASMPMRLRRRRRRGHRLWQLPEKSIQDYARWIEQKPIEEQSPEEKRFLFKYQCRCVVRQGKLPRERLCEYVARLEAKEDRTPLETELIQRFHRHERRRHLRHNKKHHHHHHHRQQQHREKGVPPPIFWKRELKRPPESSITTSTSPSTTSPLSVTMANLKESMDRLGLSSNKLRDVTMDE